MKERRREMKEQSIASVVINKAGEMTEAQRKEVADWLRKTAKELVKEGSNYSTRFRAAFLWN